MFISCLEIFNLQPSFGHTFLYDYLIVVLGNLPLVFFLFLTFYNDIYECKVCGASFPRTFFKLPRTWRPAVGRRVPFSPSLLISSSQSVTFFANTIDSAMLLSIGDSLRFPFTFPYFLIV